MMRWLTLLLAGLAAPANAQTFSFPAPATETARISEPAASYRVPVGPWMDGAVPTRLAEGTVEHIAWRLAAPLATLDLMNALRGQLEADGWTVEFTCETAACGGYDFRYALSLLTEPDMHVDLGDFRYLTAEKGPLLLSLTVSRAEVAAFVQLTRIDPEAVPDAAPAAIPDTAASGIGPSAAAADALSFAARLEGAGSLVLDDLVFASGAADLAGGDTPSLRALAGYLAAHREARVALVGHTDASGALAGNITLSKARAQAVRKALVALGADAGRIEAEGVGYLAPRASNLAEEGRTKNRRVEVMLTAPRIAGP
ncbi:MAG: OmpA family protein [Gemmobacter sp.]|jgi:OOP family OmpA-OmpF porin|nr:OmpA family protein [Gemmobacter sp.]